MRLVKSVPVTEQPFTGHHLTGRSGSCPAGFEIKKQPSGKISWPIGKESIADAVCTESPTAALADYVDVSIMWSST